MTYEILDDMKKRDRLAKRKDRREEYKKLRNDLVKRVRKAEKDYITTKISDSWNNKKKQ